MVEDKKENPKKNTKIKASTGAWWKSTVVEVDGEVEKSESQDSPAEIKSDDAEQAPKKKSPGRKRAPRKKAADIPADSPDQTPLKVQEESEEPVQQDASAKSSPAEDRDEVKSSPKRKRSRRPKKVQKTEDGSAELPADSDVHEKDKSGDEDDSVEKPKESARKRSPRKKKPTSRNKEEEATEKDTKKVAGEGVQEEGAQAAQAEDQEEKEKEVEEKPVLKLLINAEEPEECRLALLENGRLESIHVSTITRTQTKNNIYKGEIVAIEPNLQAAFVEYGTEKNGFLPFSEIHPEYYKQELDSKIQDLVDAHQWKRLSITDVVEKGQDVLVQVVKEEVGKKGANMTTYLSLPGRSVVLMPGSDSSGISRKISGEERRSQLRKAMNAQNIPEGIGWIVRTASADITRTALARDVGYLLSLWEEIRRKGQNLEGIGQVYEDHQSVLRFLREHFDPEIEEILVDDKEALDQVNKFISHLPSKQRDVRVRMHKGSRPIFNQYSIEDQIESIYQPKVNLPSGGSIVIDPTEALVAIDVNSGSTSKGKNFEQSIFQANMEAASELARQLRLRDLGGLIVVDFIDMRNKKHIRDVEKRVKQAMKRDKAKVDFSRISKFGLMQISRQKLGAPIEAGNYRVCKHCRGRGTVRSVETLALFYLRRIQTGASRKHIHKVECRFPLDVAQYLLNKKRHEIQDHEAKYKTEISIIPDPGMSPVENEIHLIKQEKDTNGKKQA